MLHAHQRARARIMSFSSTHAWKLGAVPNGCARTHMYFHARACWCAWGINSFMSRNTDISCQRVSYRCVCYNYGVVDNYIKHKLTNSPLLYCRVSQSLTFFSLQAPRFLKNTTHEITTKLNIITSKLQKTYHFYYANVIECIVFLVVTERTKKLKIIRMPFKLKE